MNVIAAAVRGMAGMSASGSGKPFTQEEMDAYASNFPVREFPHLRESLPYTGDFYGCGFDLGIRALARGLLAEAR